MDKEKFSEDATDILKILLTAIGAVTGNPIIGASHMAPKYIYKDP